MSFKARRLRVQFPCPPGTVIELGRGGPCHFPTDPCDGGTCWFQSPIVCDFPSPILCEVPTDPCLRFGTCPFNTCWFPTPPCQFGFHTCMASPCPHFSAVGCPPATDVVIDPGKVVVDPEQLPALREALEARLKEIDAAEQALKEYEEAAEGDDDKKRGK
jgi:hypothetical protein